MKIDYIKPQSMLQLIFFGIAVFSMMFQFPFAWLSAFVTPSMAMYLLLSFNNRNFFYNLNYGYIFLISFYYLYLACILVLSAFSVTDQSRITRFLLILAMLPLFFIIDHGSRYKYFYKIFILFSIIKSLTHILLFSVIIIFNIPIVMLQESLSIKHGMIFYDAFSLHILLEGAHFMVLAFLLHFTRTKKIDKINAILLFGIFIAGNFAYLMGLLCFLLYNLYVKFILNKKWYVNIMPLLFIFILIFIISYPYIAAKIQDKREVSNFIRIEQARILLTTGNIISGNGFGYNINVVGQMRDYTNNTYYELQTLYMVNQIGIIGYMIFMFSTIYIFYKKNKEMLPIYLIYIFYSFWNPYCFDSGHMIIAVLLLGNRVYGISHGITRKKYITNRKSIFLYGT